MKDRTSKGSSSLSYFLPSSSMLLLRLCRNESTTQHWHQRQPVSDQCPVQVQKRFTASHPQVSLTLSRLGFLSVPGTRRVGWVRVIHSSRGRKRSDGGLIQEKTERASEGERSKGRDRGRGRKRTGAAPPRLLGRRGKGRERGSSAARSRGEAREKAGRNAKRERQTGSSFLIIRWTMDAQTM